MLLLTKPMSMARYAAVMGGFDAFLGIWEPRVRAALPMRLGPWFDSRRRGGLAQADVDWLSPTGESGRAPINAPGAIELPLRNLAEVLGSLYVIEGSALGGRVIGPYLADTLGLLSGQGASYFHGFGDETGAMWNDFRDVISTEIGDSLSDRQLACQSAKLTFGALVDLFESLSLAQYSDSDQPSKTP